MESKEEYHDPDYAEASVFKKEDPPNLSEEEKINKIKNIVRREFGNELDTKENEIMLIDQRMLTARRALHELRYHLVNSYYKDQKLQLTSSQLQDELAAQNEPRARAEVSALLRDGQREIHPSLRKLLGKKNVDLKEIFKIREPRNKARKDYSAMLQTRNYTVAADSTKSLRPGTQKISEAEPQSPAELEKSEKPKKVPRHIDPKITNVVTLDEATRNKMKYRYRIIIGNTSKYAPGASRADRSTHTWLLYVRGAAAVLRAVVVRLHHSYAPHHVVRLDKPPFHLSRRGWGEFPARVELHFALPERNRPAAVDHTVRLDRHCTGLQTLGAETVVDVWLYSTPEMLEHEHKDDDSSSVLPNNSDEAQATESSTNEADNQNYNEINQFDNINNYDKDKTDSDKVNDSWLEFFSKDTTELNVDDMFVKNIKKEEIDLNELDDSLDANIIMNKTNEPISPVNNPILYDQISHESDSSNFKISQPTDQLPTEILNQSHDLKKRIMKYIDPTTGKIYYLEMDRDLDLTKVQEIVINNQGNVNTAKISPIKSNGLKQVRIMKSGMSDVKSDLKTRLHKESEKENNTKFLHNFSHIENDHCYLRKPRYNHTDTEEDDEETLMETEGPEENLIKSDEVNLYNTLREVVLRLTCVRVAVNYLLKKIPLISENANNPAYLKFFPFTVENEERYWKLDFVKRRNIEWSRAKLINKLLIENLRTDEQIWRTKQILIFSRLHGYFPVRTENIPQQLETGNDDWSSWNLTDDSRRMETNSDEMCSYSDINTLTLFDSEEFLANNSLSDSVTLSDSDDDIEVVKCEEAKVKVKSEVISETSLEVLPVENDEDRLRFMFIEKKCADIGIELRNEDIGNGYSYSAVHAVLLRALRDFAEELLRSALCAAQSPARPAPAPPRVWTCAGAARRGAAARARRVRGARGAAAAAGRARAGRAAAPPRAALINAAATLRRVSFLAPRPRFPLSPPPTLRNTLK